MSLPASWLGQLASREGDDLVVDEGASGGCVAVRDPAQGLPGEVCDGAQFVPDVDTVLDLGGGGPTWTRPDGLSDAVMQVVRCLELLEVLAPSGLGAGLRGPRGEHVAPGGLRLTEHLGHLCEVTGAW